MGATLVSVCADIGMLRQAALAAQRHFMPA